MNLFGLAQDIAQFGHDALHAEGRLIVLDCRFNRVVARRSFEERLIELPDEIQPAALSRLGIAGPDVANGLRLIGLQN